MVATLYHELITAPGATPTAWLIMTHGILGSGGNWRSIARKLLAARPTWGAVLVDLRNHGRSERGEPPHTLAACAADVAALIATLAADGRRVAAVLGHSFGGKVALAHRRVATSALAATWVLDASPSPTRGAATGTVGDVLGILAGLPPRFARREDFVAAVVAAGQATSLAQWLAMNLEPVAGGAGELALRLDLAVIHEMIEDYRAQDLWPAVDDPTLPGGVDVVLAGRSDTVSAADRGRFAASAPHVTVHEVADAGHWLHIDAPAVVVDLLAAGLPDIT